MSDKYTLLPLFDTIDNISETPDPHFDCSFWKSDYRNGIAFLTSYNGSQATFNAYRRELERLLHWSWKITKKSVCDLRRADIEAYLQFCQKPPESWISLKKVPRFIVKNGLRVPNSEWYPFVVTISKSAARLGEELKIKNYKMSETALKEIFAILSSFYNFLIQEEVTEINPVAHIRQKSKFLRKHQGKPKIRRLSELQWEYVIETAEMLARDRYLKDHDCSPDVYNPQVACPSTLDTATSIGQHAMRVAVGATTGVVTTLGGAGGFFLSGLHSTAKSCINRLKGVQNGEEASLTANEVRFGQSPA